MTPDPVFAENRFGLGPRGDGGGPRGGDPCGWAEQQLARFDPQLAAVPSRAAVANELADYQEVRRAAKAETREEAPAAAMMSPAAMPKMRRRARGQGGAWRGKPMRAGRGAG